MGSSESIEECEWDMELEDLEEGSKLSSRLPIVLPLEWSSVMEGSFSSIWNAAEFGPDSGMPSGKKY